jgi:hypothetical protein
LCAAQATLSFARIIFRIAEQRFYLFDLYK